MIFLPKFDPDADRRLMPRATVLMGVPTFYTRLLQNPAPDARGDGAHAAVRLRLGAAARRDPPRVARRAPATPSSSATA